MTKTPGLPVGSTGPARIAPEHARPHLADAAHPPPPRGPPSLVDLLVGFLYSKYESRNIKMNHFKVNASVAPSTLTTLCDDHVRPPLDIFTTQKGE